MKKRLLAMVLALILVFVLGACGDGGTKGKAKRPENYGSKEVPIEIGDYGITNDEWKVTVLEVKKDVTEDYEETSEFFYVDLEENQVVEATIELTYLGKKDEILQDVELGPVFEGSNGESYERRYYPEDGYIFDGPNIKKDETLTGKVVWAVPRDLVEGGLLIFYTIFPLNEDTNVYFKID